MNEIDRMHHYDVLIDRDKTAILPTKRKRTDKKSGTPWKSMGLASGIGFEIVVPIVLLLFLGVFLDSRWGTHPTMTVILMGVGLILAVRSVIKMITELKNI